MAFDATDWSITATGDIRYIGDTHIGASPTYATVIEFHRALQDFADDALASGDDLLDISSLTPSDRSTDNIITLLNSFNIDQTAAEHLYDGSIIQAGGADIWDGIVNFGNPVFILVHQDGAVVVNDFWNDLTPLGFNGDALAGISHRFMIKTRTAGADIDGRRLLGLNREFNSTFGEFSINGTARGNNVLALSESTDLNNATAFGTVATWTSIVNSNEGYVGIDVNGNTVNEFYYSDWTLGTQSINDFFERLKYLTRRGTAETIYGLAGDLFRGITHEIDIDTPTGTFVEPEEVSWPTGTGQLMAIDSVTAGTKMWIQLLNGVAPTDGQTITGVSTATADVNVTVITRPLSLPFVGASTGSAIIGSYGLGIQASDLTASDLLFDLTNSQQVPPNNVSFVISGVINAEDYILIGPEAAGVIDKTQMVLSVTLNGAAETQATMTAAIPTDTPTAGTIRIVNDSGFDRRVAYASYTGAIFTFSGPEAFNGVDENDAATLTTSTAYITYIDQLATGTLVAAGSFVIGVDYIITTAGTTDFTLIGAADSVPGTIFTATGVGTGTGDATTQVTSESFTSVYLSDRALFIRVRDGKLTPIKTFETTGTLGSAGGSSTAIRTSDA